MSNIYHIQDAEFLLIACCLKLTDNDYKKIPLKIITHDIYVWSVERNIMICFYVCV